MSQNICCTPLALGDFNGDGKPDLAIAGGSSIAIALGKGDGFFATPNSIGIPAAANIAQLAVADLNHDGKADIVSVNQASN